MTFSHDGLRDTLTHLAAPPYFYENLRRELLGAQRNKSHLTLIRFLLVESVTEDNHHEISLKTRIDSHYEVAILHFAELIKSSIRAEDLCARLGRFEFTLILKAEVAVAESLAERVLDRWSNQTLECKFSILPTRPGESSLEVLNRLDFQELR